MQHGCADLLTALRGGRSRSSFFKQKVDLTFTD